MKPPTNINVLSFLHIHHKFTDSSESMNFASMKKNTFSLKKSMAEEKCTNVDATNKRVTTKLISTALM